MHPKDRFCGASKTRFSPPANKTGSMAGGRLCKVYSTLAFVFEFQGPRAKRWCASFLRLFRIFPHYAAHAKALVDNAPMRCLMCTRLRRRMPESLTGKIVRGFFGMIISGHFG